MQSMARHSLACFVSEPDSLVQMHDGNTAARKLAASLQLHTATTLLGGSLPALRRAHVARLIGARASTVSCRNRLRTSASTISIANFGDQKPDKKAADASRTSEAGTSYNAPCRGPVALAAIANAVPVVGHHAACSLRDELPPHV